jgi:hypothetical protein
MQKADLSKYNFYFVHICVTISLQLVEQMSYQGSSGRVWILQNMRANHSHCEICRLPCVTGYERKGVTGHDW